MRSHKQYHISFDEFRWKDDGAFLEDIVASQFASRGYYVETSVTERQGDSLQELDVVATNYATTPATRILLEAKSGQAGFADLFKLYGQKTYLEIEQAILVHGREFDKQRPLDQFKTKTAVSTLQVNLNSAAETTQQFDSQTRSTLRSELLLHCWQAYFFVQRKLFSSVQAVIRHSRAAETGGHAKEYFRLLNDEVFFERDVRRGVVKLLTFHKKIPRLALAMVRELSGHPPEVENPARCPEFSKVLYQGAYFPAQACMHYSHRARLNILKSVVDYCDALKSKKIKPEIWTLGDFTIDMTNAEVYSPLVQTMKKFEDDKTFRKFPLIWQTFLGTWGGFFIKKKRGEEIAQLANEVGATPEGVEQALTLFDSLFPTEKGWWRDVDDEISLLIHYPMSMQGIGALRRLKMYNVENYEQLKLSRQATERMKIFGSTLRRLLDSSDDKLIE